MSYQSRMMGGTCTVLVLLNCFYFAQPISRRWKTFHMDKDQECHYKEVRNDNMEINDYYEIKSDEYSGRNVDVATRRPAECTVIFNFGDRYVGAKIMQWKCANISRTQKEQKYLSELYVAIYDVCETRRRPKDKLLAKLNCSDSGMQTVVKSSSSCLTVYHHRGHVQHGYFFLVEVIARAEIIAFPVGGIAGIIVGSFVITMVLVKLVCIVSGYERRLPIINVDIEEQKRILESYTDPIIQVQTSADANDAQGLAGPSTADIPTQALLLSAEQGHRVLRVSKSTGSATSAEMSSEFDYEFLEAHERPNTPRLKRYPSVRASSIWRHK